MNKVEEMGTLNKSTSLLDELGLTKTVKKAEKATREANAAFYEKLDFSDTSEAEFATKGLIDAPDTLELLDENGVVIWSQTAYDFLHDHEKAPDTANPSLWQHTINNNAYGLFKVTDGIYQVRGFDITNVTLIEGETGWIVLDPVTNVETLQAAMQLVEKNLGKRPISAVIISHSHPDHYGGIKGLMEPEEAADKSLPLEEQAAGGKIPIIVPEYFQDYTVNEFIYVGQAVGRRACYQYGAYLNPSETGRLTMGLGMMQPAGTASYIGSTFEITKTGETYTIDGIKMVFQMTPGTEAPAEMNTFFPDKKALWMAENGNCTLHNLYTLRGAQIRDGNLWAKFICEAITLYGDDTEVVFQSHHWPRWGKDVVREYLVDSAAVYKFINDQTLTYINQGYTPNEIANMIKLPEQLEKNWFTRGYYGTVAHNSKAVYQKYMGWYDANPVNLHPLPPEKSAQKWMEYLGLCSADEILRKAKKDFDKGEYQWVAQVTNTMVFADPTNEAARLLCADALEQLGYQSEAATWRNVYLTGALELREGKSSQQIKRGSDLMLNMTASNIFDFIGIILDKGAMAEYDFTVNVTLKDTGEKMMLRFKNGAVLQFENASKKDAELSITTGKNAFFYILAHNLEKFSSVAMIEGDRSLLELIMNNLNQLKTGLDGSFNIVEP